MELPHLEAAAAFLPGLLPILLLLLLLLRSFPKSGNRGKLLPLPPSPPGLPLLGHIHLLGKLPHQSLLKLARKYGGYMMVRLGTTPALVVSTPEAARQVLKVHDQVFANRPLTEAARIFGYELQSMIWAPYGDHWRMLRKFSTTEIFTSQRVETTKPARARQVSEMLRSILKRAEEGLSVNLSQQLKDATFSIMLKLIMNKSLYDGSTAERAEALVSKNVLSEAVQLAGGMHIGEMIPWLRWLDPHIKRMKVLRDRFDGYLQKQVDQHRESYKAGHLQQDLIGIMVSTPLSFNDDVIKSLSLDLTGGGMDTSAATVTWAMSELMLHPSVMHKVQEELKEVIGEHRMMNESDLPKLKYFEAVIKETLRLHPAAPLFLHKSSEACEVDGYLVPANTMLIVNAYAIARDPLVWTEPTKFDPERFMGDNQIDIRGQHYELLPFGTGRRICPGMQFGLSNAYILLGNLLHLFDWRLTSPGLDMSELFGMTVNRVFPLELVPRMRLPPQAYEHLRGCEEIAV